MLRKVICASLAFGLLSSVAAAANLAISLGIRETGSTAAIGEDGYGAGGGIEWVNLDGQNLVLDGTWQQMTFDLNNDPLTPFAGASADGLLDGTAGIIEHIRIRNVDGVTAPLTVWLDSVAETVDPAGLPGATTTEFGSFEGLPLGSEYMFQEPGYSGSTSGNILPGDISQVVGAVGAFAGTSGYQTQMTFVDNDPSRWVRWTTFNAAQVDGGSPTIVWDPADSNVLSFWMKATPEPSSLALLALGGVALVRRRFR